MIGSGGGGGGGGGGEGVGRVGVIRYHTNVQFQLSDLYNRSQVIGCRMFLGMINAPRYGF